NPSVIVRLFGVAQLAGQLDGRIDFNGLDVSGARAQSRGDVVAGSSADDRHVRRCRMGLVGEIIVAANLAPARTLGVGEVINMLKVVTCGLYQGQAAVFAASYFQQLIGRIDPVPERIHRPRQDDRTDHGG